ncbi:MAG: ketoacyl-ACP synthase III [Rikenellaceae bacterium]
MSYLTIQNVKISGVSACVPAHIESNNEVYENWGGYESFLTTTGIECKRKADSATTSADLSSKAAEQLIEKLGWQREDIDALVFVSQTPDYILPATSCVLHGKLGLSEDCYTLDISLGCSGWVYALSVVSSLLQNGDMKKALLLAGDTCLKLNSEQDKSTYPLFGDAGTATALEFDNNSNGMKFTFNTDGSGAEAIVIRDGGYRNPVSQDSFLMKERGEGIISNRLNVELDGMSVFSFGISKAPKSVNNLLERFNIDREDVDYYLFHQANMFMNEKIRKKLKLSPEKVPYSLKDFANTSSASIPLTMVTQIGQELESKPSKIVACGFGVGLSWGSVYFETDNICVPQLIEI